MRFMLRTLLWFLILLVALPCAAGAALSYAHGWPKSWREANWSSSGLLPKPEQESTASIRILAARAGGWKSIFAEHMWIVLKPQGASEWRRYEVVGWGMPVRRDAHEADAYWYSNKPRVVYELHGPAAGALIPRIEAAIAAYPWSARGSYTVWPGPNSNSFVAWVVRHVDGFDVELPAAAVGKDFLGRGIATARTPSGTGYEISFGGFAGLGVAVSEGLEIHLLGTTIGIDPMHFGLKLPALGDLRLAG